MNESVARLTVHLNNMLEPSLPEQLKSEKCDSPSTFIGPKWKKMSKNP